MTRMAIGLWVAGGMNRLAPSAPALRAGDWTPTGYPVAPGVAGVFVFETAAFAGADRVVWSLNGSAWTDASREPLGDEVRWSLTGLTGAPGAFVEGLRLRWSAPGLRASPDSDIKSLTLPDVPAAFRSGDAMLRDATAPTGDRLTLSVAALPASELPLTSVDYALSSDGATWDVTVETAPQTGTVPLTVAGRTWLRLRATSALGSSGWSVLGPVTPTTGVSIATLTMTPSRTTLGVDGAVHFAPDLGSLDALAAEWGTTGKELLRHGYFVTTFSADPDENYAYDRRGLTAPLGRAWTAGEAIGPYVAHQYRKAGTHVATTVLRWGVRMAVATATITVNPLFAGGGAVYDPATQVRVVAPDGDFSGLPLELSGATRTSDLAAALAWWAGAAGRCLLLKGGASHAWPAAAVGTRPPANGYLGAWGRGRAVVTNGGIEAFNRLLLTATATAGQTDFAFGDALESGHKSRTVFVDGVLRTSGVTFLPEGTDMPTSIRFAAGLTEGQVVRVFFNMVEDGVASHAAMLDLFDSVNVTIADLDFQGAYRANAVTTFDGVNLNTFLHDAVISPMIVRRGAEHVTVGRVTARGWHTLTNDSNPTLAPGPVVFADCAVTDWRNYGFYTAVADRYCIVGCTARQPWDVEADANGEGNKSFNAIGSPNHAAHGPIRMSVNRRSAIHENIFASSNSWAGQVQPTYRLSQNSQEGLLQSVNFTRNEGWHGANCMGLGGAGANGDLPAQLQDDSFVEANVLVAGRFTTTMMNFPHYVRARNNIHMIPETDGTQSPIVSHTREALGDKWFAGGEIDAPEIYNETVIVKEARAGAAFFGVGAYQFQRAGFARLVGPLVTAAGGETVLDFTANNAKQPTYQFGSFFRAYSSTDGGATWVELGQAGDTRLVRQTAGGGDPAVGNIWTHPGDGTRAGWRLTQTVLGTGGAVSTLRLELLDGRVAAAGEQFVLSWNPTLGAAGVTFYEDRLVAGRGRDTLPPENSLFVFDGALESVTLHEPDGPIDASRLTTAGQGPFTGIYRPDTGSVAFETATSGRVALADYTGALRGANPSRGALEPGADQTGWPGFPAVPSVSYAWARSFTAGDTLTADDLIATIDAAGVPALTTGDIVKIITVIRAGSTLSMAAANPLQEGDVVQGAAYYGHPLTKRVSAALAPAVVAGASFTRVWIANGGRAGIDLSGAGGPNGTAPIHIAFRAYSATAIPGDTRRVIYSASGTGLRINQVATSGRVTLNMGSTTLVNVAGSVMGVGAGNAQSFLASVFPGGTGPGGITGRLIVDGVTAGTSTAAIATADLRQLRLLMIGLSGAVANQSPDIVLDTWFGIWTGGTPTFADFFDVGDGNRVRNPGAIRVAGMTPTFLLNGRMAWSLPINTGLAVEAGYPALTDGASFTTV